MFAKNNTTKPSEAFNIAYQNDIIYDKFPGSGTRTGSNRPTRATLKERKQQHLSTKTRHTEKEIMKISLD